MSLIYPLRQNLLSDLKNDFRVWSSSERLIAKAQQKIAEINDKLGRGGHPLFELPGTTCDLQEIYRISEQIKQDTKTVIILGTGGSSLGARALLPLRNIAHKTSPVVKTLPNLAGGDYEEFLDDLNYSRTKFLVISKSGETTEVIAQVLIAIQKVKNRLSENDIKNSFIFLVQPGDNTLRRLAQRYNIETLTHDPNLGGRFSVLSNVGLLPAAIAGLNIKEIREGAKCVLDYTLSGLPPEHIPAIMGAAFVVSADANHNKSINVIMPYINRLARFNDWYVQLWAESLGKQGRGTTPLPALGPRDQHSLLQMFLDGKKDKSFTFITLNRKKTGSYINPDVFNSQEIDHLQHKNLDSITNAFFQGTLKSLTDSKIPCREIKIEEMNEFYMGALMMHFMLETIFAASMLGVNPFDQPMVEKGKGYAKEILTQLHVQSHKVVRIESYRPQD
ncbi:hypothetical protein [Luteithermobacter gelatinilyticus]|uniref:hypothetical protein n=1 Tax=Luteithermobacter gelatinilyticus TaxID=2582913 RepID=UPI001106B99F|nr:hypothetical protein [Luteithermobacter gelatinilyticus]